MNRRGFFAMCAAALGLAPKATLPAPAPLIPAVIAAAPLNTETWTFYVVSRSYGDAGNRGVRWLDGPPSPMTFSFTPPNSPAFCGVDVYVTQPKKPRRRWRDAKKWRA